MKKAKTTEFNNKNVKIWNSKKHFLFLQKFELKYKAVFFYLFKNKPYIREKEKLIFIMCASELIKILFQGFDLL